ncbi:MAG: HAMP domain-containing histidine kinase [Bacteroidetes bacterium]|nr:HAMP domain-containing histidine kinase [Bacteroidota bacterium]
MSFRTRVLVVVLPLALLPLLLFAWIARQELSRRLENQFVEQADRLATNIRNELDHRSDQIAVVLREIAARTSDDNRLRRGIEQPTGSERRYVVDYAGELMRLAGLDILQLQDTSGRILSSGHFRNEFDRLAPEPLTSLRRRDTSATMAEMVLPEGSVLGLLRADSIRIGERMIFVVGGVEVGAGFLDRLEPTGAYALRLTHGNQMLEAGDWPQASDLLSTRVFTLDVVDADGDIEAARLGVARTNADLRETQKSLERWLAIAVGLGLLLVAVAASILAARISQPLVELADKTTRINLDRINETFHSRRRDEIGQLSLALERMVRKLKARAREVRDAERRAALGELARQVNHDIKNGLTPMRNVFRHLSELADESPDELASVLRERRGTIESSINYLSGLAANYARLTPESHAQVTDVSEIVGVTCDDLVLPSQVSLKTQLEAASLIVADPVSVRRIVENLISNAVDGVGQQGSIVLQVTASESAAEGPNVLLIVEDDGIGMDDETRMHIFDDFYTTKDNGTGLGLSIVRRLVMDAGGRITVESEPSKGTRFVVSFPSANPTSAR